MQPNQSLKYAGERVLGKLNLIGALLSKLLSGLSVLV